MNRRSVVALAAVAATGMLLSACGVDKVAVAQSGDQVPVQGVGAAAGHVTVDDALVVYPPRLTYPAGSDAPLALVVTNGAATDDRLVSAHSDAARAVVVTPAAAGTTPPVGGCVLAPYPPEPAAGPGAPPATAAMQLIPDGATVIMTPGCPHLLLVGLKRDVSLLDTVPIELTFANAGTVDLVLPVQPSNHPLPRQAIPGVDTPTGEVPPPDSGG